MKTTRHTRATELLSKGVNPAKAAKQLGQREYGEHRGGVIGNVLKDFHSPFENRVFKGLVFGAVGTNIALTTKRAWQF